MRFGLHSRRGYSRLVFMVRLGDLYVWLFKHLPGFKVMREAEKFSALIALVYAIFFAAGTENLSTS